MADDEFVEHMKKLLSLGKSRKDVSDYFKSLGIKDEKVEELMKRAESELQADHKSSINILKTLGREEPSKKTRNRESDARKEEFRKNVDSINEVMQRLNKDLKPSQKD